MEAVRSRHATQTKGCQVIWGHDRIRFRVRPSQIFSIILRVESTECSGLAPRKTKWVNWTSSTRKCASSRNLRACQRWIVVTDLRGNGIATSHEVSTRFKTITAYNCLQLPPQKQAVKFSQIIRTTLIIEVGALSKDRHEMWVVSLQKSRTQWALHLSPLLCRPSLRWLTSKIDNLRMRGPALISSVNQGLQSFTKWGSREKPKSKIANQTWPSSMR